MLVLIAGVVLLTLKKPDPKKKKTTGAAVGGGLAGPSRTSRRYGRNTPKPGEENDEEEEEEEDGDGDGDGRGGDAIALAERGARPAGHSSKTPSWEVGEDSEEDEPDHTKPPLANATEAESSQRRTLPNGLLEARGLMSRGEEGDDNDFGEFATPSHPK